MKKQTYPKNKKSGIRKQGVWDIYAYDLKKKRATYPVIPKKNHFLPIERYLNE